MSGLVWILPRLILLLLGLLGGIFLLVFFFRLVGGILHAFGRGCGRICGFVGGEIQDALRFVGSVPTSLVFVPLVIVNIFLGRWSAARHYGRALQEEVTVLGTSLYRVILGHPARLLGLSPVLEGFERRVPDVVAKAPGPDRPSRKSGSFEGYTVIGSLPGGGSGARLFIARPDKERLAALARAGHSGVGEVVIKSFSLYEGSTLPQILRENRALEAARRLGLVLEHRQDPHRFYYVMPYVPGDDLATVTRQLHNHSGSEGLRTVDLRLVLGYLCDLLQTLDRYHQGGLWHKDVKPDNIIISDGRAHLVDLGLVTPLRSAMTLTTHGTEYFRDPELVRMALRGVKVQDVNGVKFDLYSVGAVLFSVVENSFPAHGSLSRITRRCPEALKWIVRRSMAEMGRRYGSAREVLADLRFVLAARDPFAIKPAHLPSFAPGFAEAREEGPESAPVPPFPEARAPLDDPAGRAAAAVTASFAASRAWSSRRAARRARRARRHAERAFSRRRYQSARSRPGFGVVLAFLIFFGVSSVLFLSTSARISNSPVIQVHGFGPSAVVHHRGSAEGENLLVVAGKTRGTILLLDGFSHGLHGGAKEKLDRASRALAKAGYSLLDSGERADSWEAAVRRLAGVIPPSDAEMNLRLQELLNRTEGAPQALLWIWDGPVEGQTMRTLIPRDGFRAEPVERILTAIGL